MGGNLIRNKPTTNVFKTIASGSLYWRIDYNGVLSEIQASFNGSETPTVLSSANGVTFSRLGTPLSSTNSPSYNVGSLNNNTLSGDYIGYAEGTSNNAYQILFDTPKVITSIWLAPQGGGSTLFNVGSYCKLYKSGNGTTWELVKQWAVSDSYLSQVNSPFNGTLLRPNILIQFVV